MAGEETHIWPLWAADEWATEREPHRLQGFPTRWATDVLQVGRECRTKDSEEYKVKEYTVILKDTTCYVTFEDISLFAAYAYACENAVDLLIFLYLPCAFRYRRPLEPGLKIAITLRFLATGNSFQSMEFGWCSAHNTIGKFLSKVSDAIVEEYATDVFRTPTTPDGWR